MSRDRWLGIELRHFAALAAVARERSFRGAAERLGYVQSAISRQVAYLEESTGTRLIERSQGPKPVFLTEAGELLLSHAHDIIASVGFAKSDLESLGADPTGTVRIGFFPGVPARILSPVLATVAKQRPPMEVVASEAVGDAELLDLVRKRRVDLAFTHLPPELGPFDVCEVVRVPWMLVVPADAEIVAGSRPPTADEIVRLPLIAPRSARVDPLPAGRLGTARVVFRTDVAQTAQHMAAAGLGAALVPQFAVQEHNARTVAVELGDLLPPAVFGLAWHRARELGSAAAQFRDLAVDAGAGLGRRRTGHGRFTRATRHRTAAVRPEE
jgi:DNA-binding transcriptional LysR family regulator